MDLHEFIITGYTDSALGLIEKTDGSKLALQNTDGNTPLHLAIINGRKKSAFKLVEKVDQKGLVRKNNHVWTPLHLAIKLRQDDLVKELICSGQTAIYLAIEHGQVEVAQELIQSPDRMGRHL